MSIHNRALRLLFILTAGLALRCGEVTRPDPVHRLAFRLTGDFETVDSAHFTLTGSGQSFLPSVLSRNDSLVEGAFENLPHGFRGRLTADLLDGILVRFRAVQEVDLSASRNTVMTLRPNLVDLLNAPDVWNSAMNAAAVDSQLTIRWNAYPDSGEFRELDMFYILVMDTTNILNQYSPTMGLSNMAFYNRTDTTAPFALQPGFLSYYRVFIGIRRFGYYWPGNYSVFFVTPE